MYQYSILKLYLLHSLIEFHIFSDYRNSHDLHIGVTDSNCRVYEYDSEGLHSDYTTSWSQCLAVPILSNSSTEVDPVWIEYWDFTLHEVAQQDRWTEER